MKVDLIERFTSIDVVGNPEGFWENYFKRVARKFIKSYPLPLCASMFTRPVQ
jgi:hypothetical protein